MGTHQRLPSVSPQTKYGAFPLPWFCCQGLIGTVRRSDCRSALTHFAGPRLIGLGAPSPPVGWHPTVSLLGRRRLSPVPTMAVPTFHALYAAGFFGVAAPSSSPLPWPSSNAPELGSQLAPRGVGNHGAAGFASCCGPLACTFPISEGSTPRFNAQVSPNAGGLLQRCLGTSFGRTSTG